jgi:hypothetical protein
MGKSTKNIFVASAKSFYTWNMCSHLPGVIELPGWIEYKDALAVVVTPDVEGKEEYLKKGWDSITLYS